jgi:sphingosine-1-phosphate phosphatase 1
MFNLLSGIPISLVYLSHNRYNIDLTISIVFATVFCCWVCCSRLYLGMHSLLDVIGGVVYAIFIICVSLPFLNTIDEFMLDSNYSPLISLAIGFSLCCFYPNVKMWGTARADTAIIIGTVVGFSVGAFFNNQLGFLQKPDYPPLYDIRSPSIVHLVLRTLIGLLILIAIRQIFKTFLLRLICFIYNCDHNDPIVRRKKKIELPYNYITYFVIGLNIAFLSPYLFRLLGIERDYSYTEL